MMKDEKYSSGCVAIVDILGMRGLWRNLSCSEICDKIKKYRIDLEEFKTIIEQKIPNLIDLPLEMKFKTFSDTFIITISTEKEEEDIDCVPFMGLVLSSLNERFLSDGLLVRGAVSNGKFYYSDEITMGPSIDDCAEWYDKTEWSGIHLTPKTSYAYKKLLRKQLNKLALSYVIFQPCIIPLKDGGKLNGIALNYLFWSIYIQAFNNLNAIEKKSGQWPLTHIDSEMIKSEYEDLITKYYTIFNTNDLINQKLAIKFEKTIELIDYCMNRMKNHNEGDWN